MLTLRNLVRALSCSICHEGQGKPKCQCCDYAKHGDLVEVHVTRQKNHLHRICNDVITNNSFG